MRWPGWIPIKQRSRRHRVKHMALNIWNKGWIEFPNTPALIVFISIYLNYLEKNIWAILDIFETLTTFQSYINYAILQRFDMLDLGRLIELNLQYDFTSEGLAGVAKHVLFVTATLFLSATTCYH